MVARRWTHPDVTPLMGSISSSAAASKTGRAASGPMNLAVVHDPMEPLAPEPVVPYTTQNLQGLMEPPVSRGNLAPSSSGRLALQASASTARLVGIAARRSRSE